MKKWLFSLLLILSFASYGQNRFPSIDSAKNYTLRFIKNSAVESFTNLRMQNVTYGTLELLDSLAGAGAVDSIFKVGDTLKYSIGNNIFTVGVFTSGGSSTDTTSLSNRINLKLNISDTAAMLSPYLRSNVAAATYQPVGSYLNTTDTASMLSPYLRSNTAAATYVPQSRTITINGTTQDLSANRTFNIPAADSSVYATVTRLSDTAAAIRSTISAAGVTYGTYAQRVALTNSVQMGHRFYQTNERIGLWVRSAQDWDFYPTNFLQPPWWQTWFTSVVSGGGATAGYVQNNTWADSTRPNVLYLQTGTTNTGTAQVFSQLFGNTGTPPIDTLPATKSRYILYARIKLFENPTESDNYRFCFGFTGNVGGGGYNDSTTYGAMFRLGWHRSDSIQIYINSNGGGISAVKNAIPLNSITGKFCDFVIVFSNRRASFYINGTHAGDLATNANPVNLISSGGIYFGVNKLSGTSTRRITISNVYLYQTTIE